MANQQQQTKKQMFDKDISDSIKAAAKITNKLEEMKQRTDLDWCDVGEAASVKQHLDAVLERIEYVQRNDEVA